MQLRDDVGAYTAQSLIPDLPVHSTVPLPRRMVDAWILKDILKAVKERQKLEVYYQSMSSDEPAWRKISPHAFAYDGLTRWHTRAYCHNSKIYKDFLLSRIFKTRICEPSDAPEGGDKSWNEIFTVTLKPHPMLSKNQANAVAQDYGMKNLLLNIPVRLALLYYLWGCSI